jgi:ribosomal protein L27
VNVRRGGDDTLYAIADGKVMFDHGPRGRKRVNVVPL